MNLENLEKMIAEIKNRTRTQACSLKIQKDVTPGIFDSKFGGLPYWDLKKEYPQDSDGGSMMLLAQINLDKEGIDDKLPQQGMLQFFISRDECFGLDFDEPDKQQKFRVVYHEAVDYDITREQIQDINPPLCTDEDMEDYTPVWKEAAITVAKQEVYMCDGDYRFEQLFQEIVQDILGEDIKSQSVYSYLGNDEYDKLTEALGNEGHWLLGYPYFTQADPREHEEAYRYYDTLLFQMDSDCIDNEDYILWGDCGVGNFFISQEDLKQKDFSKILYNWDCC